TAFLLLRQSLIHLAATPRCGYGFPPDLNHACPERILPMTACSRRLMLCLLILLPGCMIPYGLPKISQTPPAFLGTEATDVHTFRVDITRDFLDISATDYYTLGEISSGPPGWLLPQTKISATYGVFI